MKPDVRAWPGFVEALTPEWVDNEVTKKLLALVPDDKMAKAIWGCLRTDSIAWLYRNVPVLDNKRPIDLLNDEDGKNEVKWALLSSPWW
ncbi:antitoxin Xre/MbcA/ParS toxin-binding domain-containing protein [Burkholderia gladioli]|uniref:antitoxin Xre/MbcA/ParS toxin-binding domain-containing protein n=1 Tax=Burkholderia gladioli TaxID=28095 RepID=UPI000A3F3F60|nr:antitoxin Xre/MbcA/ParS toxin-binding domain-containing protein [Burkholderia gladioli]MDA0576365.1 DUF2384 domain-containing protein [Burkholderia gladioli]MDA0604444.1 DUF2384 domain-containing protein [Burkholderia gladioli]